MILMAACLLASLLKLRVCKLALTYNELGLCELRELDSFSVSALELIDTRYFCQPAAKWTIRTRHEHRGINSQAPTQLPS